MSGSESDPESLFEDDMDTEEDAPLLLEGDICGDGSIMKEILTPGTGYKLLSISLFLS